MDRFSGGWRAGRQVSVTSHRWSGWQGSSGEWNWMCETMFLMRQESKELNNGSVFLT